MFEFDAQFKECGLADDIQEKKQAEQHDEINSMQNDKLSFGANKQKMVTYSPILSTKHDSLRYFNCGELE